MTKKTKPRKKLAKRKPRKKVAKKTRAVAKRKSKVTVHTSAKKPIIWSSAGALSSGNRSDIENEVAGNMLALSTKAFNVPPQGVTILANQPYINKVGWKVKMDEYYNGRYRIKTKWHHLAIPKEQYAIVEAIVEIKKSKTATKWEELGRAIGEATPDNIKLAAVKKTLNMMAETRAKNRAMFDIAGAQAMKDATKNIQAMQKQRQVSQEQASAILEAGKVTAEEMDKEETKTTDAKKVFSYQDRLRKALYSKGIQTEKEAVDLINTRAGLGIKTMSDLDEIIAKEILPMIIK